MMTDAVAAVALTTEGPPELTIVQLDAPRAGEVLVRLEACGICHTDEKFRRRLPLPAVFGHEGLGFVESIGDGVTEVRVGDRVLMSYPFCTVCAGCSRGEPWHCERIPALKFGGSRMDGSKPVSLKGAGITSAFFQQSSFATHAIALEQALVPVADDLPAHILAALPCGIQTGAGAVVNSFGASRTDALLVIGAGAVGLAAVMAAAVVGMTRIFVIEPHERRRSLAFELGASGAFAPGDPALENALSEVAPGGVSFALDTSATVDGLYLAISNLAVGGTAGIVSYPLEGEPFPFNTRALFSKVGTLVSIMQGSSVPRRFLPRLIDWYRAGEFPVDRLVSTYPFTEIGRALTDMQAGDAIKPVLLME